MLASQLGKALDLDPRDLRSEADAGHLPHTKVGKTHIFNQEAVEKALAARAAGDGGGRLATQAGSDHVFDITTSPLLETVVVPQKTKFECERPEKLIESNGLEGLAT